MARPLRALIVEDLEQDALLLVHELKRGGFDVTFERVDTPEAMSDALAGSTWDVVIADYAMPHFSAPMALVLLKQRELDLPFLIVSGKVDEEIAVAVMRAGAADFVAKDKLARLSPAIERELQEVKERQARRVAQAASEQARRDMIEAQAASRAKSRFLTHINHELRTPLNAIIGFSELLDAEGAGSLNSSQKKYVQNIVASSRHLLSLINGLLDIAKIEAGRMEIALEPTALAPIVEHIESMLMPLARKGGVKLSTSTPEGLADLLVDPLRLKQILYNLLSNGIKFTPRGGSVDLATRASGDYAEIAVRDTGIGIAPENLPRLFHDFEQLDPIPRDGPILRDEMQGTGLGLALTRRLVELQGGEISVASELGRGSQFMVRLPLAAHL